MVNSCKLAELSVKCISKLATLSEMRMVGQPCWQINLKRDSATEAADLFWRASTSGHLLKRHVQVAMY